MNLLRSRTSALIASCAALAMGATPALAHGRWGPPPPPPHHHHGGGGLDAGDVLAGLLVIGGVAAIATAASNNSSRDGDYEDRGGSDVDYPGGPVDDDVDSSVGYSSGAPRGDASHSYSNQSVSSGFGLAVDTCTAEVERSGSNEVDAVGNVSRNNGRVAVEGRLSDGRGFACSVDDAGQVRSVSVDGRGMI